MAGEKVLALSPDDVVPGDLVTTIFRWCLRNGWGFCPNLLGGEPSVDPRCAWMLIAPNKDYKTAQNRYLNGVERVNGLVKLSDVMRIGKESEDSKVA